MAIDTIKATAILDGAVDTADLADGAVTTAKITDGNITTAKIANGEITDAKLATGISSSKLTGALPAIDGSSLTGVDPADGSITTAKLDSTLDLSGKTVTYGLSSGDMPSGSVLQIVYAPKTTARQSLSNGSQYVDVGHTASITPVSNNSNLLFRLVHNGNTGATNLRLHIKETTGGGDSNVNGVNSYTGDHSGWRIDVIEQQISNTVTTERTFKVVALCSNGIYGYQNGTVTYPNHVGALLTITEIKA